jgi:hypothetical protein
MRRKRDGELTAGALEQPRPLFADARTEAERAPVACLAKPATIDRHEAVARLDARVVCFGIGRNARDDQSVRQPGGSKSDTNVCGRVVARKRHQAEVAQERRGEEMDPPRGARACHAVGSLAARHRPAMIHRQDVRRQIKRGGFQETFRVLLLEQ